MRDYSEDELDFIETEMDMTNTPWQEKKRDFCLERYVYSAIRKDLNVKFPRTAKYTSDEKLAAFAKELSSKIGLYQITVMPYEALMQSFSEQWYRINLVVGNMRKSEFFALVDEGARQVGVYVPKTKRLMELERKIDLALNMLDRHIASIGGKPNMTIRATLENFLFEQKHPEKLLPIKVIAVGSLLNAEKTLPLPRGGQIELRFKIFEKDEVLYYHIAK